MVHRQVWQTRTTKCSAVKKDGTQCKLKAEAGQMRCEHHSFDVMSFLRDPFTATGLHVEFFPKNHHPACDRTGQNDCDCPDKPTKQLFLEAFNRSLQASLEDTREFKMEERERYELLTTLSGIAYDSMEPEDMWLPPHSHWRQFRFQVWDSRAGRLIWVKCFDTFRNTNEGKKALLQRLREMKPIKVFYMTSKFLRPQLVGPDPNSNRGWKKFKKRGLMRHYNNAFLGQELFFDVDFKMDSFDDAAAMTKRVVKWACDKFDITHEDLTIVFSGGKGFHVIWFGWDLKEHAPQKYIDTYNNLMAMKTGGPKFVQLQKLNKTVKTEYIKELQKLGILVDYEVTRDPRRIIRLPGSIHHKGRPCKIIAYEDLDDFIPPEPLW